MADNLTAKWADTDDNESLPIRFEDVSGVLYGVTIIAQADGTLLSTFPVSAASLPLPTGAATAAKQPALGTAGTASSDVITVQGIASMVALKVDGSAATQPVSDGGGSLSIDDGGATLSIDDGGSSLTVDGTVSASQNGSWAVTANQGGTWNVDTVSTVAAVTSVSTVTNVATIGTSVTPGTGAGNLGKAEDAAHNHSDTGVFVLAVRRDTADAGAGTDGDYASLNVNSTGHLWCASVQSGTWSTRIQDGSGNALTSAARGSERALSVQLVDASGNQVTSFGGGAQYAEDAAHVSGDSGTMALAVRNDSDASLCGTTGDYTPLQVDSNGYLKVNIKAGAGSGGTASTDDGAFTAASGSGTPMMGFVTADSVDSGDVGVVGMTTDRQLKVQATNAGTFAVQVDGTALSRLTDIETNTDSGAVVGNGTAATAQRVTLANDSTGVLATVTTLAGSSVAHGAADSGNPHKIGARATTSLSGLTLAADANRTDLRAGVDGVLINRPHTNLEDIVSGNASNTDGTNTACITAQGVGIKTYLQTVILTNTSSSNTFCEIKDGATTRLTIPVPANGGAVVNLPVPIGGTANTAWNFDPGAATTTMYCSMVGWKSKV